MFYRAFEGMNPTLDLQDQLIFNSAFESGNLDCVIKLQQKEYDLFLRIDSNTRGHTSWYYFSVKNMSYRGSATFHICNLTKPCALYEQGMRPFVFSRLRYDREGISWHQGGAKCVLDCKEFRYEDVYEKINPGLTYRLTFDYEFEDYND